MNKDFFTNNRKKFMEKMEDNSLAVFFSGKPSRGSADQFTEFEVDRNFYYLTGIERTDMMLVMTKELGNTTETLFIPPIDEHYEKWIGILMRKNEASETSGIQNIQDNIAFEKTLASFIGSRIRPENIYLLFYYSELNESLNQYMVLASKIRDRFPSLNIKNSLNIMTELRSVKTPEEIQKIRESIKDTNKALENVMSNLKPDTYEYEARYYFESYLLKRNIRKGFTTIAASGKNGVILHYDNPIKKMKSGDLLMLDLGSLTSLYSSDISRTYPVNGKFTDRQKEIYNIVLETQKLAMSEMKPGITEMELEKKVIKFYAKALKSIKLIKDESEVSRYYYHSIGHPLGLDVHDLRRKDRTLVENGVYTVEPGLYIAEEGIGIRIEDDVLLTKNGAENLSIEIIKEINDIENFMKH